MNLNFDSIASIKSNGNEYQIGVNKTDKSTGKYAFWKITEIDPVTNWGQPSVYTKIFTKDLNADRVAAIELNYRLSQRY